MFSDDKKPQPTNENKPKTASAIEKDKYTENWLRVLSEFLSLRRTKKDKFHGTERCIVDLPEKKVEEVRFKLNQGEAIIYGKIFEESKAKVNEFLNNQHNKLIGKLTNSITKSSNGSNLSAIFVYLLRLRQVTIFGF